MPSRVRPPRARWAVAVVGLVVLAACGDARAVKVTATVPVVATPAITTAAPPTTVAATTTTEAPTTTVAATTTTVLPAEDTATTVALPTPQPPPPENDVEPTQVVGRITIPRLGLDLDLQEGITLPTLDRGPGHWPGTALPGQPGNVVVAGHRVSHTRPFRYIDELEAGDEVTFTVNGAVSHYVVTSHEIVTPDAVHIVDQTATPTATLFACHPPGSTRYRWVVHLALQP